LTSNLASAGNRDKIYPNCSESTTKAARPRVILIGFFSMILLIGALTVLDLQKFFIIHPFKNLSNTTKRFQALPWYSDTNQLLYLETTLVYYPNTRFPKLTTPMWIGEPEVETAIILSFDDMRYVKSYDRSIRPVLVRLKEIEGGRSPLSVMANRAHPKQPILQKWINDGITIEVHTTSHPCPLLQRYDFKGALKDVHSCIDLLYSIPGNTPLAFRMPFCDSQNSVSPRFYSEIFSRPTQKGHALRVDSSIFALLTPQDPEIPRSLVADQNGNSIFKKYIPPKFVNYIENYPYPYLIHNSLWEFPCIIPSDWQAACHFGRDFSQALADWKRALDAVVAKKGVFVIIFHPLGAIEAETIVKLIDYANTRYGNKVKFLNFKEAYQRLMTNLLGGTDIHPSNKGNNGVRLLDLNSDGYLDVVIARPEKKETRIWDPRSDTWRMTSFPHPMIDSSARPAGIKFVRVRKNGFLSMLVRNEKLFAFHDFDGTSWGPAIPSQSVLPEKASQVFSSQEGKDRGLRVVDVNGDGFTDLVYNNERDNLVFLWQPEQKRWTLSSAQLPGLSLITDETGLDRGHRFVDLNRDGLLDSVCSNEEEYIVALYTGEQKGWDKTVIYGRRDCKSLDALPPITERGSLMGAWFRGRILYIQNERVGRRSAPVLRYSFIPLIDIK